MFCFYLIKFICAFPEETWRIKDNDPLGTDAIHGAISRVKYGIHYSLMHILELLLGQLAWYMYVVSVLLYV
jgi:hypothetical protein